jgi:dolichyl-diphosphooligosaccharide--protein glycosyltransferase
MSIVDSIKSIKLDSIRPVTSRQTLVIVMTLSIIFSAALMLRIFPVKYGYFLNEFDPFFDYYASKFIVDHFDASGISGLLDYFSWHDYRTWYPEGRPVARTSQVGLHFAGALFYILARDVFGLTSSLYDFVVIFPPIVGALSIIPVYLIARRVTSEGGALFASLLIAFSTSIIQRGNLGWFKSEPFALLLALCGSYLFLTTFDLGRSHRNLVLRAVLAGTLMGISLTAWGGAQFFNIVFAVLILVIPFIKVDQQKAVFTTSIFVALYIITAAISPRPGAAFILSPAGLALLGSLAFAILANVIRHYSHAFEYVNILKNTVIGLFFSAVVILSLGFLSEVSGRYLTVIMPFRRSGVPLVESVAEHFVPTGAQFFQEYMILLPFAVFGAMQLLNKRDISSVFVLVLAASGVYISGSFSRLMIFSSIAIALLAAVGFITVTSSIFRPLLTGIGKQATGKSETRTGLKIMYSLFMIAVLCFPVISPSYGYNWVLSADIPTSISNSGSTFRGHDPSFLEALAWMESSTPEDSVIAAWWDYGYWITVMGNRTSLADNATINGTRIEVLGQMFMSPEEESLEILDSLDADYVLIFLAGTKTGNQQFGDLYLLGGGGDESKKQWFIRIGGFDEAQFLEADGFSPNENLWENSFLGRLMPFTWELAIDAENNVYQEYEFNPETTDLYKYQMKYPADGNGPLRLAFASSSLQPDAPDGRFSGVLIYEIVKD